MQFSPSNPIIQLCLRAMALEEQGAADEASALFLQAWNDASTDFEKHIAAFYVARQQKNVSDKLRWLETDLQLVLKINDDAVKDALAPLYESIARCYEEMNEPESSQKNYALSKSHAGNPTDNGRFYHGTKADLQVGDLLTPGNRSNYKEDLTMKHIYFTALVNAAGLAAALAKGEGAERVYIVEPSGSFENDPNVTNKKFPGNPTRSYRTGAPLKVVGEEKEWVRQTPEEIKAWKEKLAKNQGEIIN